MFSDLKKNQHHIPFSQKVVEVLHTDFGHKEVCEENVGIMSCLEKYDGIFLDLESVGANSKVYDLHRSLHKTETILHKVSDDLMNKWLSPQLDILRKRIKDKAGRESLLIEEDVKAIHQIERAKEKVMERNAKIFKILSYVVSVVDIIISVILIVLISKIAHVGENFLNSPLLITLFIAVVALVKVLFDRYVIIPWVHKIGWKWFRKRVDEVEYNTSILASIIFLLTVANKEQKSVEDIVEFLDKGVRLMKEKF